MNVLITGVPRAGTTLATAMVDGLDDALALNEPRWQHRWSLTAAGPAEYAERIRRDVDRLRSRLIAGRTVEDHRHPDGSVATSYYRPLAGCDVPLRMKRVAVRRRLSSGFLLGIKHNVHFTACLPWLAAADDLQLLCLVRHPVPTLLSWSAVDLPVGRRPIPAAERLWPELNRVWRGSGATLAAQVELYDLFLERYASLADRVEILRYEDLVVAPVLAERFARTVVRPAPVRPREWRAEHSAEEIGRVEDAVRSHSRLASAFYPELR